MAASPTHRSPWHRRPACDESQQTPWHRHPACDDNQQTPWHRRPACDETAAHLHPRPRPSSLARPIALAWPISTLLATLAACSPSQLGPPPPDAFHERSVRAAEVVIAPPPGTPKPPFDFSPQDDALLDEIQHAAFGYLWNACSPDSGMVYDRSSATVVSVAGVGFQLSAIPIGVERGWITEAEGRARALKIVSALRANPANRKAGLFYHYLDPHDAGPSREAYEHVVSTIDSALLMAGLATASSYFGGDVADQADALLREADWSFFVSEGTIDPRIEGFISLGWKPADPEQPGGDGDLLGYGWVDAGAEHRLVTFMAVCAPDEAHRVDPALYYRLRRTLGSHADCGLMVWFPWSGALFTSFFAHCWIDYAHMGPDNPAAFDVAHRARVDWWENSRRTACMHRAEAIRNPHNLAGFGPNVWGLSASDAPGGYSVPGLYPAYVEMLGATPEIDYPEAAAERDHDNWADGTVAPYASGCAIMFSPLEAVAALRHFRTLKDPQGKPWIWRDPGEDPKNHGLLDALNIGKGWVASDYVAIDEGPLVLAIENARTGLVWRLFSKHPFVKAGMARLRLDPAPHGPPADPSPAKTPE